MTEEPTSPRIELFKGDVNDARRRNKWFFRIRSANRKIVAQSEGYSRKKDCIATASHLRGTLIEARMFDMDKGGEELL